MSRRRIRPVLGGLLAVTVGWVIWTLDLIDGRGLALVSGGLLAVGFVRQLVIREAMGRPGPFTRALAEQRDPPTSNRLAKLERSLDLATVSAGDARHVLRPLVVNIAGTWLQGTHGIDLGHPHAGALLPPEVWALAAPTSRRPDDPHAPGITLGGLDTLIAQLEALR